MVSENNRETVREVVGIFFDGDHLKAALADLDSAGFEHEQISLLASEFAVEKSLGDLYTRTNEHHDPARAPVTAFVLNNSVGDAFRAQGGGCFSPVRPQHWERWLLPRPYLVERCLLR